jgi:hypothetical protein
MRKKRQRDPRPACHAASRPERLRPQRQRWRARSLRLGRTSHGPPACGGPARPAFDPRSRLARRLAPRAGWATARWLLAEHHADRQSAAHACDREFRRRAPYGCRSSRADRRAATASGADHGRAATRRRPSARASARPDAHSRKARPRSRRAADARRHRGSRRVRRRTAGPGHRYSCRAVGFSASASEAEHVGSRAGAQYAVTDPGCCPIAIAFASIIWWRHLPGRTRRVGLPLGRQTAQRQARRSATPSVPSSS